MQVAKDLRDLLSKYEALVTENEELKEWSEDLASRLDASKSREKGLEAKLRRSRKPPGVTASDEEFLWGHRRVEIVLRNEEGRRKIRIRFTGPRRAQIRGEGPPEDRVLSLAMKQLRGLQGE